MYSGTKKLLLGLLLTIFLVNYVSALDFDNIKTFNKDIGKYGSYEVKNAFGFGGKLSEVSLDDNTFNCDTSCEAKTTITTYEDSEIISGLRFYDLRTDKEVSNVDYSIKITTDDQIISSDYWNCELTGNTLKNGSAENLCGMVRNNLVDYQPGEILPAGTYKVLLSGSKPRGEMIDWQIRTKGVWSTEWATWGNLSAGATAQAFLVSPVADYVSPTLNNSFVCSANVTNGATVTNISLISNISGTWTINKTIAAFGANVTDNGDALNADDPTATQRQGIVIMPNFPVLLVGITKYSSSGCTVAYLLNSSNATIATSTFSGDMANFSYQLNAAQNYSTICDKGGAAYNRRYQSGGLSYPYVGTNVNVTAGYQNGGRSQTDGINIITVTTQRQVNSSQQTFFMNISAPTLWSCYGCDSDNTCGVGIENRTIYLDSTIPVFNITLPSNITYLVAPSALNYTITEAGIMQACRYSINGGVTNTSITCGNNASGLAASAGSNTWMIAGNDSIGNSNQTYVTFFYNNISTNVSYINPGIEGETYNFNITINTSSLMSLNGTFTYNNTQYTATVITNGNTGILTNDVTAPLITAAAVNITFFWNYSVNGVNGTSGFYNQTIFNFAVDNCTSGTVKIMNITNYDERLLTPIANSTIEVGLVMFNPDRSLVIANYSGTTTRTAPVGICLARNLTGASNYSIDAIIRYQADNYAIEYYNIERLMLTNTTTFQEISLYDLNSSESTDFQLTFTGADFLPSSDTIVYLNRRYIASGFNFSRTVEAPKTDANGQTILHLVRNNVVYDLTMVKAGVLIASFSNQVAFCQDFAIGDCKITLNAFEAVTETYNYETDIGITYNAPVYNNNTNTISFTYTTLDGSSKTLTMNVSRNDIFGNRTICSNTLSSASGTITCSVPANLQEAILITTVYDNNGQLIVSEDVSLATTGYGEGGLIIYAIMALSLILLFSESKEGLIFAMILALISGIGLGLVQGSIIGFASGAMWFIIVCMISLWKLNKDRPQ